MNVYVVTQVGLAPYGSADVTTLVPPKKREGQKAEWAIHSATASGPGQLAVVWVAKVDA